MQPLRYPPPQARPPLPHLIEGPKDKAPGGQAKGFEGHTTKSKFDCRSHAAEDQDPTRRSLTLSAIRRDRIAVSLAAHGFMLCWSGTVWRIQPIRLAQRIRASASR